MEQIKNFHIFDRPLPSLIDTSNQIFLYVLYLLTLIHPYVYDFLYDYGFSIIINNNEESLQEIRGFKVFMHNFW